MRLNLLPKVEKFYKFFNDQVDLIYQAAKYFKNFMDDFSSFEENLKKIEELEHQVDVLLHEIIVHLNTTFITPIDREDIHQLANNLDDIMDYIQGSASKMSLFKIKAPTGDSLKMAETIINSIEVIKKGIKMLPTFKDISNLRKEIKGLEKEGDRINRKAIAELFNNHTDVLEVIKWKEIYESMEMVIDKCEDVMDVLEAVMIKHA
ncbi:MAG: DUF47 domain-containing protein [Armatimonadetes bacterium]|nr:DUF47 domain-containing protein [Armatimonadota bacterium]